MSITARTRVLTLFGDPVEHSASPEIQNAAFLEAGAVSYTHLTLPPILLV